MASQRDISFTYDDLDSLWPLILGDYADATAAYYHGDYSKSLPEAQKDKHRWVLEGIEFQPGYRVIDIGCGWGPILNAIRERGGEGVGLTLSPRQAESCRRLGLQGYLLDWKALDPDEFGRFDAVVSLGAFEHFCSIEEYVRGEQEKIYGDFFKLCSDLLPPGRMLYLQTMTWGAYLPWGAQACLTAAEVERYTALSAPKKSDERILGYVKAFFPGSWLPRNKEQIVEAAAPYFDLIKSSDGRLDYIQTLTEWEKAWHAPKPGKLRAMLKLWPNYIWGGRAYWAKMQCVRENALREVFIRNLFGHQRLFFRKRLAKPNRLSA